MNQPKFRIYANIVCLEMACSTGHLWWDQGYGLGYTPFKANLITQVRYGKLRESPRHVLAARIMLEGRARWVAVNLPRSDIPALEKYKIWPEVTPKPYTAKPVYTSWPEAL